MKQRVVIVQFEKSIYGAGYTGKLYDFITDIDDLKKGDRVVVSTAEGVAIAKVVSYKGFSDKATAWVIQKVDMDAHKKRLELAEKQEEIMAKMRAKRKELEDIAIYQMLAKEDPEMAELLESFKAIK